MKSKKRKVVSKAILFFMLIFPYNMICMEESKIEKIDYISQLPSNLLAQILAHLNSFLLPGPRVKRDPESNNYIKNFLRSSKKFWYNKHLAQAFCVSCINGPSFSTITKKPTIIDTLKIALAIKTSTFFKIIKEELKEKQNVAKVGWFLNQQLSDILRLPFESHYILLFLLKAKYPLNSYFSPSGEPLLITLIRAKNLAAYYKQQLVELLLTYGANSALTDNDGKNALDYISTSAYERPYYEELFKKYSLANKKL